MYPNPTIAPLSGLYYCCQRHIIRCPGHVSVAWAGFIFAIEAQAASIFVLRPLPIHPHERMQVTFAIDEDGILSVEAYVVGHGSNSQSLTIDSETSRLSEADIKAM